MESTKLSIESTVITLINTLGDLDNEKKYYVHKYLLLQLIIAMIIISITIGALMIHFYLSSNFEGALYMFFTLATYDSCMCMHYIYSNIYACSKGRNR